jgi:PAS domain S-box-containing protein
VTVQPRDGDPIVCEDHMGVLPYQGDRFEGSVGTLRDVTERKERGQELQELKSQYETLAKNFPEGAVYLIDTDLQCVRAGGKELSKVGLSPDDVEGTKPHALFPEKIADEHCHYYEEALDGNANTFEQEYGGERYRIQTVPVRIEGDEIEYVMAVSKNVTEYTESRERLRRRDEQLSRLHDATRDLFGADSPEQAAEIASRAAEDILDLPLNGIHFYDDTADGLVPVTVSDRSREVLGEVPVIDDGIALETFQDGEFQMYTDVRDAPNVYNPETPIRSEMYIPIGSHGIFIISSRQVDAFADADVEFARTLAANTTAALERISRQAELQTREKELLRKNERLDEFASVVSHDLRSPLTVADGHIDLAKQECDSDHLTRAAEAIDRSQALIDDLLILAREGDAVTGSETVALVDVAQDSWETVETRRATLGSDATGHIKADRNRLQQLFENLHRNAVEHGGDEVTVHIGDIDSGFYVADTGSGIPESDRDEIFEAGYSTADHGTGIGLRIVEQIVEAHGWEISVTESAQGGARFEVTGVEKVD